MQGYIQRRKLKKKDDQMIEMIVVLGDQRRQLKKKDDQMIVAYI